MGFLFLTLEALELQDIMPGYAYFCLNLYCRWIYNACFGKKNRIVLVTEIQEVSFIKLNPSSLF